MSLPSHVGRYAVRRRIGSGGFATVWLAYDEQLDAPVALKVLADNWTEDHHVRTRFLEEGRYLRRVESPHVVTVYDAGELDDGRPYLVMTYADQGTLADRLEAAVPSLAQSAEIVRQVASGLQSLHDHGILHRDVKPANVLFRTVDPVRGVTAVRAMVGDLGLGKALDASSRLTMIAGTPSFVAPEQAQGETPDSRADQYSLGVLTYLLLTGRTPWRHTNLSAAADPDPAPPLGSAAAPFPAAVEAVVARALSREREDRWDSVEDFSTALGQALAEMPELDDARTIALPADPHLTLPGARPSPRPATALPEPPLRPLPEPSAGSAVTSPLGGGTELPAAQRPARRRRRGARVLAAVVCLVLLAGGGAAGWFGTRALRDTTSVTDDRDVLTVSVPSGWDVVHREAWTPPGQDGTATAYPSLSAGTSTDWQQGTSGDGVFLGVLPLDRLPSKLPQHDACTGTEGPVEDGGRTGLDRALTVYYTGCPGVTVERLVQIANNRVLWVQVRAADRATANQVLASVDARL